MNEIITVSLDDQGNISYTVRPCPLSPAQYGRVLASVILQVAKMLEIETNKQIMADNIMDVMLSAIIGEIGDPTAETSMSMTQ